MNLKGMIRELVLQVGEVQREFEKIAVPGNLTDSQTSSLTSQLRRNSSVLAELKANIISYQKEEEGEFGE